MNTPVLNHLNRPQQRALILRDQLQYLEPQHLNTFLEGLTNDEPPTYRKVNGKILPELTKVNLSEKAKVFELGNVLFPNENNAIYQVHFIVEKGQFDIHTSQALPQDDANVFSLPIHAFIASNMLPLFENKFHAIFARMNKINEARASAYHMACQPTAKFHQGDSLARLNTEAPRQEDSKFNVTRKRQIGDPILRHSANKRKKIGLNAIPDEFKSSFLGAFSPQIQSTLFSEVAKSAFPKYNDLMMASWNVVSIHHQLGSEMPGLHMAIVELGCVLKEIDHYYSDRTDAGEHMGRGFDTKTPSDQNVSRGNYLNNRGPKNRKNAGQLTPGFVDNNSIRMENVGSRENLQQSAPSQTPKIKKEPEDTEIYQLGENPLVRSRDQEAIIACTQNGEVYIRRRSEPVHSDLQKGAFGQEARSSSTLSLDAQSVFKAHPLNRNGSATIAQQTQQENRQNRNMSPKRTRHGEKAVVDFGNSRPDPPKQSPHSTPGVPTATMIHNMERKN